MDARPFHHRLSLRFDADALAADVARIGPEEWIPHFNVHHHDGGWSGVALRAPGGDATKIYPDPDAPLAYAATSVLARCPAAQVALAALRCPVGSARFLRLAPGSRIREHRDYDLAFADGEIRLHIPVTTDPEVEFVLAGERIDLRAGECWYLDVNQRHRVENRSERERVHLVVDCAVDEWLAAQLPDALTAAASEARVAFEAFRARVLAEPSLQQALVEETADRAQFVPRVVRRGRAEGFDFGAPEVLEALREGRRSRILRWL
ncbi:MAG TPA: aspartyl/asparaginyl beta-hydroxylase domain-containing protein [Myxococcota bacterium]|nr:aspartyl/asparaginyl beta-hydroxylase domain-containing protein [Myxococcota bacterium]